MPRALTAEVMNGGQIFFFKYMYHNFLDPGCEEWRKHGVKADFKFSDLSPQVSNSAKYCNQEA